MLIAKNKLFWTDLSRYGAVHRGPAAAAQIHSNQRCLLVFVHGLFGDCRKTWGQMPQWVLENAGLDMPVISFAYPSRSWHRCSIAQAAEDLGAWLETEFRDYPHLLFVTHSTGGLVVKTLLNSAAHKLFKEPSESDESAGEHSPWTRTRRVLNIAVPHFGGSPLLSNGGKWIYRIYYFLLAPFFACVRFLSQGSLDWGKNQIIPALAWRNPWLISLEKDFHAWLKTSRESNRIAPVVQDIGAKSDLSVPFSIDEGARRIYIRGTHKSIKIPRRMKAPIVTITAELVRQYAQNPMVDLVHLTLNRIGLVNRTLGTLRLIGPADGDREAERIRPAIQQSIAGTQQAVAERIIAEVRRGGVQPRKLLVTGAAGVGKTSVLRHIAWKLGVDYLSAPGQATPLPLLIPMQQITVSEPTESNYSWEMMWQWWIRWGLSLAPEMDWSQDWLEQQFHGSPVAVILDGLDDFLQIHKSIGFSSIVKLLRDTEARYAGNPNLSIVIGIRNTLQGIERLVSNPRDIHEILRLSVEQAKQVYPACQTWIETVRDRELMDFILTPLILSNYEPDPSCQISAGPDSQSTLLCQTVRTVLLRSGLVAGRVDAREIEIEHLGSAMIAIAWLFFYKSRGEINIEILQREALEFHRRWKDYFAGQEQCNETFYLESIAAEKEELLFGFSLAGNPIICEDLLQRSLFVPTGPGRVRFRHRHWQEFLLGQYLSLCIRMHNFDELGIAAFHSRIYRMAGDTFGDRVISEGCIRALFQSWRKSRNPFVAGNAIAFLTWNQTTIEPVAIRLLLGKLSEFELLSRLVLLGGLAYRVLLNRDNDVSLPDIRRALIPRLKEFANPQTSPVDDPAASSLSWMYQKAFSELFDLEAPEIEWPGLDFNDQETLKALPMVCSFDNGNYVLDERAKSLQVAFLVPIMEAFNDPRLAIRAMHYLYYLIVARKHGVHYVGLSRELPALLAEGCKFQGIIESFHWTPELFTFYQRCQRYHARVDSESLEVEHGF
ncbi:MAG: ATP-binding protein [Methylococcaceae bacterium]|nr:ATP-binding protein [Methylococcaceae bacterium]MCI0733358.1 ATP-binding protein [Methylococcaceae bacterium]